MTWRGVSNAILLGSSLGVFPHAARAVCLVRPLGVRFQGSILLEGSVFLGLFVGVCFLPLPMMDECGLEKMGVKKILPGLRLI